MTKYILHGGTTRVHKENASFFREMTLGLSGRVHILLNYFARETGEWEKCAEEDTKQFIDNSENDDLEFEIAQPEKLALQLEHCHVMYMRGGKTDMLEKKLLQTKSFWKLFEGKVIAGSSAGANVLSTYNWSNTIGKVAEGFGVLKIKVLCHHVPENIEVVRQLAKYGEPLPVIALPDFRWVVIYT